MGKKYWLAKETSPQGATLNWQEALTNLSFNSDGLIPAIAQQYNTGEVLLLAYMNKESLEISLTEGRACFWSRSRNQLWRKGESSGQVQWLKEIRFDCDADTLLLLVDQQGPACHTGRKSCFYFSLNGLPLNEETQASAQVEILTQPEIDPKELYKNS